MNGITDAITKLAWSVLIPSFGVQAGVKRRKICDPEMNHEMIQEVIRTHQRKNRA